MASYPSIKLYASNGSTLIYNFQYVTDINDWQDPANYVLHESLRGQGGHVSQGSKNTWEMNITFILKGEDYEDLVDQMEDLQDNIVKFTKYILKIEKVIGGSTEDYKVMRVDSFQFPLDRRKKRVNLQTVNLTFLVDSWA